MIEFVDELPPKRRSTTAPTRNHKLQQVQELARELMDKWGLTDWEFYWDHARDRYGACHYGKRAISLSRYLASMNPIQESRETILHEIAHALAGYKHGHDDVWKDYCMLVGAKPKRCHSAETVAPNYILYCGECNAKIATRHRRKKAADKYRSRCCRARIIWQTVT